MEEEEQIRLAIEESQKLDQQHKQVVDQEEEMIRQVMLIS